ncbi:cysteine desulfurase family protein [Tuberibacillus sp. Marseille-P3662]|uniref:cysteine desulfurase family protein n=1 Tax=Tuberibacillus sp. Marseille-P3662 TaxID=1965358 RepID=UPI000A1CCE4F|nr:cysteine desulfurase family protein [Tuberibacillus sp. Marseille-P3662]
MNAIYLDHAATTPVHPDVIEQMSHVYRETFGNPSSIHQFGRVAQKRVDDARRAVAKTIGASPGEVVFTSGGTEADNLAIVGAAHANQDHGRHIITTSVEHHAVLNTCQALEEQGFDVTYLDVDERGRIDIDDFKAKVRDDTILVSVMYGNNEVGTIQPVQEIGEFLADKPALLHTDAVQAFGVVDMNVSELQVDLLSMTAHKINGPKGIGFLYIKDGTKLVSHQHGGEQERKRRAGTHNVPGIVGLSEALSIASHQREARVDDYRRYQQVLLDVFDEYGIDFAINGDPEHGLAHILNAYFPGTHVESLLMNLDLSGVAVSSGSACTAGSMDPSHVLTAMHGTNSDRPESSIRISFGLHNDDENVREAAEVIAKTVKRLTK